MRKFAKEYTPSGKFNIVNFPIFQNEKNQVYQLWKKMTGSYCYTIYDSFFGHFRRRKFHIEDAGSLSFNCALGTTRRKG